jgi:hypothetical protein
MDETFYVAEEAILLLKQTYQCTVCALAYIVIF